MAASRLKDALRGASDECLHKRYAGEMYLLNDVQIQEVAQKLHIAGTTFGVTVDGDMITTTRTPEPRPWDIGGSWTQGPTETIVELSRPPTNQSATVAAISGGFGLADALRLARRSEEDMERLRKRTKGIAEEMKRVADDLKETGKRLDTAYGKVSASKVIYLHSDFDREIEEARQRMHKHMNTLIMTSETANFMHVQLQEKKEDNR